MPSQNLKSIRLVEAKKLLESVRNRPVSEDYRLQSTLRMAEIILDLSKLFQSRTDKRQRAEQWRLLQNPKGKSFLSLVTDQLFRPKNPLRAADQTNYLVEQLQPGPAFPFWLRLQLVGFRWVGRFFADVMVPLAKWGMRRRFAHVILQDGTPQFRHRMRQQSGIQINCNRLGEAVLGERAAQAQLERVLELVKQPGLHHISLKISAIYSQIDPLAWRETVKELSNRLTTIYQTAQKHPKIRPDGEKRPPIVTLDMEAFQDLSLTVEVFKSVLEKGEFTDLEAGIVLQAYIPDSFHVLEELTAWATKRVKRGGAPIRVRLVKGANLSAEIIEANQKKWAQAPFLTKAEVDTHFKKMVMAACKKDRLKAVKLGIGSHNIFDLALGLILRAEQPDPTLVQIEMLAGMAPYMRRAIHAISGDILLYSPTASKAHFHHAMAYLIRRLDEQTQPQNFLKVAYELRREGPAWKQEKEKFCTAYRDSGRLKSEPRRKQSRPATPDPVSEYRPAPDTDWSDPGARQWIEAAIKKAKSQDYGGVPLVINGQERGEGWAGKGVDPAHPLKTKYRVELASLSDVENAVATAEKAQSTWSDRSAADRCQILTEVAGVFETDRGDLISAMMMDVAKPVREADAEVSEAVDFIRYYADIYRQIDEKSVSTKGPVLVAPPWNFSLAIPTGNVAAALLTGAAVILKPAPEAVWVGWQLVNRFWQGGVPREVLQFMPCDDDPVGTALIKSKKIQTVMLTGASTTAAYFMDLRPDLNLVAETGGKNSLIVTAMADTDQAIQDIVQSAFSYSGQKCSAVSNVILEAEVYDDPQFREQLADAVQSIEVGDVWKLNHKMGPLIRSPNPDLIRGLTELEAGEEWLVKPEKLKKTQTNLWSGGVKWGVRPGSFMHLTELFGPVVGVIRARNLQDAIRIANATPYGLTAGLQSLDPREQKRWINTIQAGNLYINRGTTGAIVGRQPFGGCKESRFGSGFKAGGPHYLKNLISQTHPFKPVDQPDWVLRWQDFFKQQDGFSEVTAWIGEWVSGVSAAWRELGQFRDLDSILGQKNWYGVVPQTHLICRIKRNDPLDEIVRILAIAQVTNGPMAMSFDKRDSRATLVRRLPGLSRNIHIFSEKQSQFLSRLTPNPMMVMRLLSAPTVALRNGILRLTRQLEIGKVAADPASELLRYCREISISHNTHRYGYVSEQPFVINPMGYGCSD